jgi:microsomal prostaglandin-E synthase 2
MLADGSNPEGVDPSPPLAWSSKEDIKDVIIYGGLVNPPVTKIRTHLAYHNISYQCVKRNPNSQPEGHYQKIPSISVDGRQVNDSYVILKFLVPALYGTLSEADLKWEEKITYGIMISMEAEAFEDSGSVSAFLAMGGYPAFLAYVAGPCLPIGKIGKKMPAGIRRKRGSPEKVEKYGELKPSKEYLAEFKDAVGDKPFLGGENPGAIDVSLFGTFKSFEAVPYVKMLLQESGLGDWYSRVEAKLPQSLANDVFQ